MNLTLAPNALYTESQSLNLDKVATLIGENGSGKSTILGSIFEQRLANEAHQSLNVVCFSSGQNENYSSKFSGYLRRERLAGRGLSLECLYFDKSWSKLLIFLATATKRDGRVRGFLKEKDYIEESGTDDISTIFKTSFKIDKGFTNQVQDALRKEEAGELGTLRSTAYFRTLDSFITNLISEEYDFSQPLRKRTINIPANRLVDVSFDYPRQIQAGDEDAEAGNINAVASSQLFDPEVSFFTQAADNDYFINKSKSQLLFRHNLELELLSDGEYQLLFLYALVDLFDSPNTLFLLDEADSHLHYKNVEKLWSLLHNLQGQTITTTHLIDSISAKENRIEHIKVVENGKINEDNKLKQIISRLSVLSRAKSVEYEVCGKLPYIVLMDDYNDWQIFLKLAQKKGHDITQLQAVHAIKKTSSYTTTNETFAKAKIDWLHGLSKIETAFNTTKIFLICDRDEASLDWHQNGVLVNGYNTLLRSIQWPTGSRVSAYLLGWKRREIKNYLLSFAALNYYGVVQLINGDAIAPRDYLKANQSSDNDSIRQLNAKDVIDPLINDQEGLNFNKLQSYIDLMPADEISEDITNMYNFITGKL